VRRRSLVPGGPAIQFSTTKKRSLEVPAGRRPSSPSRSGYDCHLKKLISCLTHLKFISNWKDNYCSGIASRTCNIFSTSNHPHFRTLPTMNNNPPNPSMPDVKTMIIQALRQNPAQPGTWQQTIPEATRFAIMSQM